MTTGAKYLGIDIKSLNKEVRLNLKRYVKTSIRLEKNGVFWFGKNSDSGNCPSTSSLAK